MIAPEAWRGARDDDPDIAISGRNGRLGRALAAQADGPVWGWERPQLDLDDPGTAVSLITRDRPKLVIHAAAMTAVDQAAREPEVALRRNGAFVGALASACRGTGAGLVLISTNEVFDGEREDGRGYREDDAPAPRNPYGRSKLAGEQAAQAAFEGSDGLWIVRTAWLYGPPGGDFPDKITAAAARRAPAALSVVSDEIGCPTYTVDLARAVFALVSRTRGGVFHLVNAGQASRYEWARAVLDVRRPGQLLRPITLAEYERHSDPPRWGVLDTSRAAGVGVHLRDWRTALSEYLAMPAKPTS